MSVSVNFATFLGLHRSCKTPQCSSNLPSGILFWGRGGENDGQSRLLTVLYFSVRSSRSSVLRYGLPSCMSVSDGKKRYI